MGVSRNLGVLNKYRDKVKRCQFLESHTTILQLENYDILKPQ